MKIRLFGVIENGSERHPSIPIDTRQLVVIAQKTAIDIEIEVKTADGLRFDLASKAVKLTVKSRTDSDALIAKTVTPTSGNVATFSLSATDTNIEARRYVYDCRVADDQVVALSAFQVVPSLT